MEKVRPWCGQPSNRGQLKNKTTNSVNARSTNMTYLVKCSMCCNRYNPETTTSCIYVQISNENLNIHTHQFNGPLSGATWVSRYQKGKTNLDFTEARDSE